CIGDGPRGESEEGRVGRDRWRWLQRMSCIIENIISRLQPLAQLHHLSPRNRFLGRKIHKVLCGDVGACHDLLIFFLQSLCVEINRLTPSPAQPNSVRAMAVELDVSADGAAINASVQRAWGAFGRIDTLINNAGLRGNSQRFQI
ncbi:hypothetical protein RJ640_023255, partial [Escallonia rubra]